mmetsp:Transcript_45210/g.104807  ORF Transcript_45210/g.104807 Transcript_45210/m.104807 type:complete len:340 (+) Transcript_45210:53-1072(+)
MWLRVLPLAFLFHAHTCTAGISNHSCPNPVAADDVGEDSALSFLQVMATVESPFSQPTREQAQRLHMAKPIDWLHVPKTGSTFLNALVQHPLLCPEATSSMIITPEEDQALRTFRHENSVREVCRGSFARGNGLGFHYGIGSAYSKKKGHLMMFARDPKGRIISAFNFHQHSWPLSKQAKGIKAYANLMKGQFLKMLVRDYSRQMSGFATKRFFVQEPTAWEIREARKRVKEGFAFVGITEEWELSMCLFHKKFGGPCIKSEFLVCHPAFSDPNDRQDQERALRNWKDDFDGPLYEYARKLFHEELKRFDVSAETCGKCFEQAGVSALLADDELFRREH